MRPKISFRTYSVRSGRWPYHRHSDSILWFFRSNPLDELPLVRRNASQFVLFGSLGTRNYRTLNRQISIVCMYPKSRKSWLANCEWLASRVKCLLLKIRTFRCYYKIVLYITGLSRFYNLCYLSNVLLFCCIDWLLGYRFHISSVKFHHLSYFPRLYLSHAKPTLWLNEWITASMWVSLVKHFFCRSFTFLIPSFPKCSYWSLNNSNVDTAASVLMVSWLADSLNTLLWKRLWPASIRADLLVRHLIMHALKER